MTDQTTDEILQGNMLICDWMQYRKDIATDNGDVFYWPDTIGKPRIYTHLEFHKSFDWLMPVLTKIEGMGYNTHIEYYKRFGHYCSILIDSKEVVASKNEKTKLTAVYKAVVSFIQWYQKQSK